MPILRVKKKPIEISVIQWNGTNEHEIRDFVENESLIKMGEGSKLQIWNSEEQSWINCPLHHFVAKGIKGEFYPISPEILERTYELVD